MKTILYNPIFINPQAYYVFPQLYDIEKGDSFIEPAVYSGYLLIEDLISNTSSQVTDTREVDFTQFAGKRIRISQYTNNGYCLNSMERSRYRNRTSITTYHLRTILLLPVISQTICRVMDMMQRYSMQRIQRVAATGQTVLLSLMVQMIMR